MSKWILMISLLVVACASKQDLKQPKMKPLIEAVYASGYVVANNEYEVTAQVDGYLSEILVQEGEAMAMEQPLFVIESLQQTQRLSIARETYELAKLNEQENSPVLAELVATVASAKAKLRFDSINYIRYTNLIRQRATTQVEADRMKLTYENAHNEYLLQESRLAKTKNQLRSDYENAQRQLAISNEESSRYVVRSEIKGRLFSIAKEKNELIRRGEVIAKAGDDNDFYLKLSVDEMDMRKVMKQQEVIVKLEAYPNQLFHGKVVTIFPVVDVRQQAVRVDVKLNDRLPGWVSGLSVEANIIIKQKKNALVIPKSVLLEGDSVWVRSANGDEKVKVKKGIETLEEVEILEGITSATQLVIKN